MPAPACHRKPAAAHEMCWHTVESNSTVTKQLSVYPATRTAPIMHPRCLTRGCGAANLQLKITFGFINRWSTSKKHTLHDHEAPVHWRARLTCSDPAVYMLGVGCNVALCTEPK